MKTIRILAAIVAAAILSVGCSASKMTADGLDKQASALDAKAAKLEAGLTAAATDVAKAKETKTEITKLKEEAAKTRKLAEELRVQSGQTAKVSAKVEPKKPETQVASTKLFGNTITAVIVPAPQPAAQPSPAPTR